MFEQNWYLKSESNNIEMSAINQNIFTIYSTTLIMKSKLILLYGFIFLSSFLFSQTGIISGKVTDAATNEPLPYAVIFLQGTTKGANTDLEGKYSINGLEAGLYNVQVSLSGYKKGTAFEVQVSNVKPVELNFSLEAASITKDTVTIKASPFPKPAESPVSLRTIGSAEIERTPGGNRDISKTIQSLPGVASPPSFRNDIIIRGGAPNENRFFLDGIEIPNINHFATQGSSGGPVGLLNVNFIREVDFYSGAFPATRGNSLSSVFDFKMKDGNSKKLVTTFTLGSSDIGLTFDGPLGKNSSFILSARRSYLQFLFKALQLPFLPTYNDFQFKTKTQIGTKGELSFIGLGAVDQFVLNLEENETDFQKYILDALPVSNQWNYMNGVTYRHFTETGSLFFVLSRNMLNNTATKYFRNDNSTETNLLLKYKSQESENKFRFEHTIYQENWKFSYGAGTELVRFTTETFQKISTSYGLVTLDFNSKLVFLKYAVFAQASRRLMNDKLSLSLGLRTDFNSYSSTMANPLEQLSPRFSASYRMAEKWNINFNVGRYYQLPAYTVLGYRDSLDQLKNKQNEVTYIACNHLVAGIEYAPWENARITVEGFYKAYSNYPFILSDSISLANLGADFGVIGNTEVKSISKGRSYGLEFLVQQKLYKGFYGIMAYTFVRSEFTVRDGSYKPSAWDNRHIVTLTSGKKFKKGWEMGVRWRFQGGAPYTPYDLNRSTLISVWDIAGTGLPDYSKLNTSRLQPSHQLDVRVDKKWFRPKYSLNLYLDIQNIYNYKQTLQPVMVLDRDANGNPVVNPNDPSRYQVKYLENTNGILQPTIGIILEF
jgi:CarboxypepD_reg-like domain/TonB-dependent Receptor Plug Domain